MKAEEIIKTLINESDMDYFAENLLEMYTSWVLLQENPSREFKEEITHTYLSLRTLIKHIKEYQKEGVLS